MNLRLWFTTLFAHWTVTNAQDEEDQFLMVLGGWGGWPSSSDVDLVSLDPDVEVRTLNLSLNLEFVSTRTMQKSTI